MPRKPKFDERQLIEAARDLIVERGPQGATVNAIAERVGAPVGSVYHRFRSRDSIVARVLLDEVEAFQAGYVEAAATSESAGVLAQYVVDWVREHPSRARLLVLYRRDELMAGDVPEELTQRAEGARRELVEVSKQLCRRWFGRVSRRALDVVRLAAFEIPYGAVRDRLARSEPIPAELSAWVAAAADAALQNAKESR